MALTNEELAKIAERVDRIKDVAAREADEACDAGDTGNAEAYRQIEALLCQVQAWGQRIVLTSTGIAPMFGGKRRR